MSEEMVEVSVEILHATENAYKVYDGKTRCWIPRSKVKDDPHADRGADVDLEIPVWLAENEGLV